MSATAGRNRRRLPGLLAVSAAAIAGWLAACAHAVAAYPEPPPGEQCQVAIAAAERAQGLPPHLLAAIGQIESGRRDSGTGRWTPWPWTIDADGKGTFLPTKAAAIAAVHALQVQGIASIDVGCVQINLLYHPDAFANLQQAFDPRLNAFYGARFLKALFYRTRNWSTAVGLYHSATTTLANDYRRKVMAAWPGIMVGPAPFDPFHALARAWAATLDGPPKTSMAPAWTVRSAPDAIASAAPSAVGGWSVIGRGWSGLRCEGPALIPAASGFRHHCPKDLARKTS